MLVPGSGLGRLAHEVASAGYRVEANEFSPLFVTATDWIFNRREGAPLGLYPLAHIFSENYEPTVRPTQKRCLRGGCCAAECSWRLHAWCAGPVHEGDSALPALGGEAEVSSRVACSWRVSAARRVPTFAQDSGADRWRVDRWGGRGMRMTVGDFVALYKSGGPAHDKFDAVRAPRQPQPWCMSPCAGKRGLFGC